VWLAQFYMSTSRKKVSRARINYSSSYVYPSSSRDTIKYQARRALRAQGCWAPGYSPHPVSDAPWRAPRNSPLTKKGMG